MSVARTSRLGLVTSTRSMIDTLKGAFKGFAKDECGLRAAALSYYTVFAMPPLLIVVIAVAGRIWDPARVQTGLEGQFAKILGEAGTRQVHEMIEAGASSIGSGVFATIAGVVGLLLGAVGALLSLQNALNHAWEVKPDPQQGGVRNFILKRLLSLGMVLGLGFLLAVSLALSTAIASIAGRIAGDSVSAVLYVADLVLSLVVLSVLFAALFKFLPDAKVSWRDVWMGGFVTAVFFVVGKFAIGLYLGRLKPAHAFGAASAFAIILIWIYYAGLILLFGAELTRELASRKGRTGRPLEGAQRVANVEVKVDRPIQPRASGR